MCNTLVYSFFIYQDALLYIIDNTPKLEAARFCAVYLQSSGCEQPDGYDWSINIPQGESVPVEVNEVPSKPLKIIHISDIHYEPEYVVGSLADCTKPVCCVNASGFPENGKGTAAGIYGMYGDCDTPWVTVLSTFENIAKNHPDVDLIYYTGDTIHHQIWNTSVESNSRDLNQLLLKLNESFPNVPVIPIIGNHEPSPVNVFAPTSIEEANLSSNWLYEVFANNLKSWFPSTVLNTLKQGGYYTVKIKNNLRIIGLNSNLCINENWWLLYQDWYKDPGGQLQWLVEVLLEAEKNKEFVHILSHVPSANGDCLKVWSREYRRIVERFRYTIAGQFNGHSHRDDYTLYFDSKNTSQVIGSSFNGGSVQPGVNPNYVVYKIDPTNYAVTEKESWVFNLTEANKTPDKPPTWFKLYDFKKDFGLKDLSLQSLYSLVQQMAQSAALRENYVRYRYKGEEVQCDDSCYQNVLCRIVTSELGDNTQCNEIKELYK
ncbi:sphingomyelin phosphodiesterase-like [Agrilus planipennis]|uniref:Sphingomyelin phosphodiesterase-like n=1 Tax=Agrilus planipennis TaxID=224129 RepID=A0A7F5RC95_AGRPL|nr:sphingomyelin phosphodiesterase-like [Agrilus planipennis]